MARIRPYTLEDAEAFVPHFSCGFVKPPREDGQPALALGVRMPGASADEALEACWVRLEETFEQQFPEETFFRSEWHLTSRPEIRHGN